MNKDISLEEKTGQWEFDSNWSYVRLYKWTKKSKDGSVKRFTLTGKITPDPSLPMFTVNILSDEKDYSHVVMREEFDNLMSFLVFVKNHIKEFPGLTDELLNTFIKYRKEQSRMDESIKESIDLDKRSDSETLEDGWTLFHDSYRVGLEKAERDPESNSLKRYEILINTHPKRLEEWMANYFSNIWDEAQSRNEQKYGYRSNNLFDLIIDVQRNIDKFPGLTMDMVNKLVKLSEVAKKKAKEKYDSENNITESTMLNNNWFLNDSEKDYITLAKDINAYEGDKYIMLRIMFEAYPSDKKGLSDRYKLVIYKMNYKTHSNEIVTTKTFTDLLDFTTFIYRNLNTYNLKKEDVDLLISKCRENSANKKVTEEVVSKNDDFSEGWEYKEWIDTESPKIKIEYKDWSDMNDRKTYSIYINIDYFDRQEIHHQDPFWVHISKSNDMMVEAILSKYFKEPISFLNYMSQNLDKFPNLTMEDVNKLVKIGYEKLKEYRQKQKTFNSLETTQESIEDYLSEGLEELDETTLKDLLMAAGVLGLSTAGVYQGTQELNKMFPGDKPEVTQQQDMDVLKVPEYKNMPDIWKDIPKPQVVQKVSVDNKKTSTSKKVEPKKAEPKKVEPKKQTTSTIKKPETKKQSQTIDKKAEPSKPNIKQQIKKIINGPAKKPGLHKANFTPKATYKKLKNGKYDFTDFIWTADTYVDKNGNEWQMNPVFDYIVGKENFSGRAYRDGKALVNGKKVTRYSIGFGTMSPNNNPKATISVEAARDAMVDHVEKEVLPRIKHVNFKSQYEFDSLASFTYNTGKKVPVKSDGSVDWSVITSYNVHNGKVDPALERRRTDEFINAHIMDLD